jgi:hypothetical protein
MSKSKKKKNRRIKKWMQELILAKITLVSPRITFKKGKILPSLRCINKRWGLQGVYFGLIERFKH